MLHVGLRRQLLYTDAASNAAPVLCASRRVAVTARIGDIDVHVHGVVERMGSGVAQTLLMVVVL